MEYPDIAYTKLMGSIAEAPKANAMKYVHVGIHTEFVATMARSIVNGISPSTAHSLCSPPLAQRFEVHNWWA